MTDAVARALIFRLSSAYFLSRCVHAVAELGLADALGEVPEEVAALAQKIAVQPEPLNRLLRALASVGIFENRNGRYAHSAASRFLRSDHPHSLDGLVRFCGAQCQWTAWSALPQALRTGRIAFDECFNENVFDYLQKHPDEARSFDRAMTENARTECAAIVRAYDFSEVRSIVDIGGGAGHLLRAILSSQPSATGTLLDLPAVIEKASEHSHERLVYCGGDFFTADLPQAMIYVTMSVLHNWSDSDCVSILRNVRRSVPSAARLLVIELLIDSGRNASLASISDVQMLVMFGGRERTSSEFANLFAQAGFELARVIQTESPLSILEAVPTALFH